MGRDARDSPGHTCAICAGLDTWLMSMRLGYETFLVLSHLKRA